MEARIARELLSRTQQRLATRTLQSTFRPHTQRISRTPPPFPRALPRSQCLISRTFSTSIPRNQQEPASNPPNEDGDETSGTRPHERHERPRSPTSSFSEFMNGFEDNGTSKPRFRNVDSRSRSGSAFSDFSGAFNNRKNDDPWAKLNGPRVVSQTSSYNPDSLDIGKMMAPQTVKPSTGTTRSDAAFGSMFNSLGAYDMIPERRQEPYPTLNASTGRSAVVDNKKNDFAKAVRQVEVTLARNKVRRDVFKQRFHERPGLKRKRLKSERWRKRFKEGFQYMVSRVTKLKKQGW